MSELSSDRAHEGPTRTPAGRQAPLPLKLLAGVLFLEGAGMGVLSGYLLVEFFAGAGGNIGGALALIAISVFFSVSLVAMGVAALRRRPWVRAAGLTWQLVQIAVAAGSFQGLFAQPEIGWLLLAPAALATVLLFAPSVVAATRRV